MRSTKLYFGVFLILILSLGLAACGGDATPTPSSAGVATATSAPASVATTAAATTVAATTPPTPVVLPTTTPLPTQTKAPATTAAPATTVATSAGTVPQGVAGGTTANATPTLAATPVVASGSSRIAYVEGFGLYVVDVASKAKKQLLQAGQPGNVTGTPVWSPDNKSIVVAVQPGGRTGANAPTELYLVNADSGQSKKLLGEQPANTSDSEAVWSPDGTTIAFTRLFPTTATEPLQGRHELWLVDASGQNPRKIANGQQPAWAPDNKRIAFVTDGILKPGLSIPQGNALHLINNKGQNEWEPITAAKVPNDMSKFNYPFGGEAYVIQYPVFLEEGKTVGFTTIGATGLVLSINSSTGGDLKLWSGQPEGGFGRTFAQPKTGSLLAVEGYPPSGFRTFSIVDVTKAPAPDKPLLQNFGSPSKGEALYPSWSPDGTQVAYLSAKNPPSDSATPVNGTLVITKVGSTANTELVSGTITALSWSH